MRGFFCAFAPAAGRAATGGCGPRAAGAEGGRQAIFQKIMTSPRAPTSARGGLFGPAEGRGGLRAFASFKFSAGVRPARAAHRATAVRCDGPHPLCLAPAMRRKRAGSVNKIQTFPQKMSRKGIEKRSSAKICRPWLWRNIPWIGRSMGWNGHSIPCLCAKGPWRGKKATCVKKSIRPMLREEPRTAQGWRRAAAGPATKR